jgi:MYXO-CTERM domain-containing protein
VKRAAIAVLALSFATTAHAWQPIYSSRPVWRPPVPYSLNQSGSIDLGGFSAAEPEVRRAMEDWANVSCTSLSASYEGATSAVPGSYEGVSAIGWIESGWRHDSSAIGVTGPSWGMYIIEADMELNGVNFTWTTGSGTFNNVNTYSIVLHEGGHYYGLGHSNVSGACMWPSYSGGVVGLAADDQQGICALYPGTGSDCTTTGCPPGEECVARVCQRAMGDGGLCSPCSNGGECNSGVCLGYPDGGGYCGAPCGSDADCGGDSCVPTSGGNQCVRFDESGFPSCASTTTGCSRDSDCEADELCSAGDCVPRPTTGNPLGSSCTGDTDCATRLCIGGVCTQSCDWLNTGSCPSGFYCDGGASASCDSGYCVRGTSGAGGIGATCSGDQECASLHCDAGRCSQPCIPGGAAGCPAGFACQVGTLPCKGSCQMSGALGDPCAANDDCTSGICAVEGDRTFCTTLCDASNPCPTGFACEGAGAASVCAPTLGGLGEECETNADCLQGICAAHGDSTFCTRVCSETLPCPPEEYTCSPTAAPGVSVCQPTGMEPEGRDGCGCRAGGTRAGLAPIFALLALAIFFVRRRR